MILIRKDSSISLGQLNESELQHRTGQKHDNRRESINRHGQSISMIP